MKKKFLLTMALISLLVLAFALVVGAETTSKYIKFRVMLVDSNEYIEVYTPNYDNHNPGMALSRPIYSDNDLTTEIDVHQIKKIDLTDAVAVNGAVSVVKNFSTGVTLENCEEIKWFTAEGSASSIGTGTFTNWTSLKTFEFGVLSTVGDIAFKNCGFETLVIPANVQQIKGGGFASNLSLTSLKFEGDVTSMASSAFDGCTALADVDLGPLTYIGDKMFGSCNSLKTVVLPSTVTEIRKEAFTFCSNLETVVMPEGLLTIGQQAFYGSSIQSIVVPSTVVSIGKSAFNGCSKLSSVEFASGSQLTLIEESAFCKIGTASIDLPDGLLTIGTNAFKESSIVSVTIPSSITSIGGSSFNSCKSLTTVIFEGGSPTMGSDSFNSCSALSSITFDDDFSGIISTRAFTGTAITSVKIPSGVTELQGDCFNNCPSLSELTFGEDFSGTIGIRAFTKTKIVSVTIPSGVTTIGDGCFASCKSLTTVVFEGDDCNFGNSVFNGCTSLESISLPKNITKISNYMFQGCGKIVFANIDELTSLTTIGLGAFQDAKNLVFTLPDSVTTIEASAFQSAFKDGGSITINPTSKLQTIGDSAFHDSNKLTSIYIPSTVTSIGKNAFRTYSLKEVLNFENCQITVVTQNMFYGASSIAYLKLPETVETIEADAFYGTKALTLLYIPNSVTSVADAFTGEQPSNAMYIYTGNDISVFSACTKLAGANIISRDEYDENGTYTGVNLVVNYSNCLAYNNGVHGQTEIDTIVKSYLEPIEVVTKCILCEMYEKNEDIPALFVNKGHSTPEYEDGIIDISLAINIEAIEAYEAITGDTVEYGLFVVTQSILGENDIVDAEGNIFDGVCAITMPSRGYSIMTMKLHGFDTEAQKAAKFTFGAYVIDGTNTDYIQEGIKADGEKYVFTSYNDVYSNDEE